jgi:hypothetical protein
MKQIKKVNKRRHELEQILFAVNRSTPLERLKVVVELRKLNDRVQAILKQKKDRLLS